MVSPISPGEPALVNPFGITAGRPLDEIIHTRLFNGASTVAPRYSSDDRESAKVAFQLELKFGRKVILGTTRGIPPRYFARLESNSDTAIEVFGESAPLAICRLAAVLLSSA